MEIRETVGADEVPTVAWAPNKKGKWTDLARQAIAAHQQHRVQVVKVADMTEYQQLRGGVYEILKQAGYTLRPAMTEEGAGLLVYLQLESREDTSVVVRPLRRPRKRANA